MSRVSCLLAAPCLLAFLARLAPLPGQAPNARTPAKATKLFAELKVFDQDGSPLRRPVEDWEGSRKRIADDPDWKQWFEARRAEVDDWMAKRTDKPKWVSGYWHDFVSPKDGSFLRWTPDEPVDYLASPSDPEVKVTPEIHDAWVFEFRRSHANRMADAAILFRLSGDKKYAKWAAGQLEFYAANYEKWPLKPAPKSRLMYSALDEAGMLIKFINVAHFLGNEVTPAQKKNWFAKLFNPMADLMELSYQQVHNHACWHRSAVGHVAIYYKDEALWQKAVEAPFGIRKQLASGVTADYLWFEQSLAYNQYVVQALLPFLTYAALEGRHKLLQQEMLTLENLMLSPVGLRFPTGQLPNPADAIGGPRRAPNPAELGQAYRLFPTSIGLAYAAKQRTWDTLLDPPPPAGEEKPLAPVESRHLAASRMAILKKGNWQVFFHYGQLSKSHAQAEALNFEAFYGDTDVTHDPGTVGYGSPLHKDYYTTGLSQNVPLVNGLGQAKWDPGQLLAFDAKAGRVAAAQAGYQPGVTAQRELKIDGERLIDTVTLKGGSRPQKLGLALHLQGTVANLPMSFAGDKQFALGGRPEAFRYWKEPRTGSCKKSAAFEVTCGTKRFRVTFQTPATFTVTHAITPDTPPAKRQAFYLETTAASALIKTIIEPIDQ